MSQLNQQLIDSLACPICLGTFQGVPVVLQCGHSFCAICINELKRSRQLYQEHQCPVCQRNVDLNNAQKNYALKSVLDSVITMRFNSSQAGDTVSFFQDMIIQLRRQLDDAERKLAGAQMAQLRNYISIGIIGVVGGVLIYRKFASILAEPSILPASIHPKTPGFVFRVLINVYRFSCQSFNQF